MRIIYINRHNILNDFTFYFNKGSIKYHTIL